MNKGQFKKGHQPLYLGNPIYLVCWCGRQYRTYKSKLAVGRGKFCSKSCAAKETQNGKLSRFFPGQEAWNKRGFTLTVGRPGGKPYKLIYKPEHPNANKKGYIREHRLIVESMIGRILQANEVVHHKDGNTLNNTVDNLEVMTKRAHDGLRACA